MDFSDALRAMKNGEKVTRPVWNETRSEQWQGCYLSLINMPASFEPPMQMMIRYPGKDSIRPFGGAQWDLMADDWEIVR